MRKLKLLVLLILLPFSGIAQTLEFTLGAGYTAVNIETLVDKDEVSGTTAEDWGQASYGISAQYFLEPIGSVAFGGELMYQYLYWYNVRVPYGTQPIRREYSVDAIKITPIARFSAGENFSFDVGPTINVSDETNIGIMTSANYNIFVSDNMDIPVKFRIDFIGKKVAVIPISLNIGIRLIL